MTHNYYSYFTEINIRQVDDSKLLGQVIAQESVQITPQQLSYLLFSLTKFQNQNLLLVL